MGQMSANTVEGNQIEGRLPSFSLVEESSARRAEFLDALSRGSVKRILFLASDAAAVALANWVALVAVQRLFKIPRANMSPPGYLLFYLPFLLVVLYVAEGYASPDLRRPEKELAIIFRAVSLSFLALVCGNFIFFKELGFSRYLFVCWYCLALAIIPSFRMGLKAFYGALWRRGLAQQRVLWVGSTEKLAEFENLLSVQRYQGYRMVRVIPASELGEGNSPGASMRTGFDGLAAWDEAVSKLRVQLVVASLPGTNPGSHELVRKILRRCKARGVDLELYSDLSAAPEFNFELDEFSGFFRFHASPQRARRAQQWLKSVLDRIVGAVGSLATVLLTPLVALLLKLEDEGPVFYRREFMGTDGQVHYYLKFRTMKCNASEILKDDAQLKARFDEKYKLVDDPRVLRVGRILRKYSIDEFPQFFSLLKGDLTFVGPRVISQEETARYGPLLPKLLSVKPGMTGFWQVMGRQGTTYRERVGMDMFYIDHWSIWLDLLIIAKTLWKVLRAEGAY
jgi:exopolysaccharide biosynthesis polyprenyl glycosylphosphotransferase